MSAIDGPTLLRLSESRLAEATVLLAAGQPSGAYYLSGYAVELRLKSRIAASFRADTIPDLSEVRKVYTHDVSALVTLAGLQSALKEALKNPIFFAHWSALREWDEQSRYRMTDLPTAAKLLTAINDPSNGILAWITQVS